MSKKQYFAAGFRDGIPICLGYFAVSFAFGIQASGIGLSVLEASLLSAANVTSAGQFAALSIIAAGASFIELAFTQLIINMRYFLMSCALSQRLSPKMNPLHRFGIAYGVTDEIFAVAAASEGRLKPPYMLGLILVAFLGWTGGTLLGAAAGAILPAALTDAMGIVLYGMFVAIYVPPDRKSRGVLLVVLAAAAISTLLYYVFPQVSGGFAIILSAVAAAVVGALLFPVDIVDEDGEEADA
jgi:predicted branched-subunit amino acid permease